MTTGRAAFYAAVLALVLALPTMGNGFVMEERNVVIVDNAAIQSLSNIPKLFAGPWISKGLGLNYYRPLPSSLYAVEYALFGLNPAGWHLISALLYAVTAALAVLLITRVTRDTWAGLVGGLLFAVLPVHVEPFAAISYQTTLLAGLFTTITLLVFSRMLDEGPRLHTIIGLALGTAAAIMSKEEAYSLPLLMTAWALLARPPGWRRVLTVGLATMAPVVLVLLLARTSLVAPIQVTFFQGQPTSTIVYTMLRTAELYLTLLVVPLALCPFYEWFIIPFEEGISWLVIFGAAIVLLLIAVVLIAAKKRLDGIAIGISWLLLGMLPVIQIVQFVVVAAERYLFIPSIGWCAAIGALVVRLGRAGTDSKRRFGVAILVVVLLAYGGRSLVRTGDWENDYTLNRATLRVFPNTPIPYVNLADYHQNKGDFESAETALKEAQRLAPTWQLPRDRLDRLQRR